MIKFVIIGLSLYVAAWLIEPIYFDSWQAIVVAAIVLGIVNAFFKPILVVLTLPITFLTLGLFLFVINVVLYWLTATIVPGFHVEGWWAAITGALITWLVSFALDKMIKGS